MQYVDQSNDATHSLCSFCYLVFKEQVVMIGGAKRDRTADLLLARQALSQLSYGPIGIQLSSLHLISADVSRMVGPSGLEPPTSPLSGVRSNQLS